MYLLWVLLFLPSCNTRYCENAYEKIRKKEFKGIVVKKDLLGDRNSPRLIVRDIWNFHYISPYMYDTFALNNTWKCVEIGDSISKKEGSLEFMIYKKNGNTLICRYDCNEWNNRVR